MLNRTLKSEIVYPVEGLKTPQTRLFLVEHTSLGQIR